MEHEAAQAIVPVMIARHGVDGTGIVPVGTVEFVLVLICVSGRVDDVATDNHEVRVLPAGKQWRHNRVLRGVSLPGIPEH